MKTPKDLYCRAGKKRCPLLDKTGSGRLWCWTNNDPEGWECCPFPTKSVKEIKRREKEDQRRKNQVAKEIQEQIKTLRN